MTGSERRRYPRLFLVGAGELKKIIGAEVLWPNGTKSDVLDLSYMGAALVRPPNSELQRDQRIEFEMHLTGQKAFKVAARVIRSEARVLATEFADLAVENRRSLGIFLTDQLVGFNLRPVNPLFFDKHQDFSQWYHGPNDTNLFVWRKLGHIQRAILEVYNEVVFFEGPDVFVGKSRDHLELPTEDYVYNVLHDSAREPLVPGTPIIERGLEILAQAQQRHPELRELFEILRKHKS